MLDEIYDKAKTDAEFRRALINAYRSDEPLVRFCEVCRDGGINITPGDIITLGEEYSCNQLKSTNGGGVNPYDYFDDPFETLMTSIIRRENI